MFFQEGRFGLGIYDFYSGGGREHLKRLLWKIGFFWFSGNFKIFCDFSGSEIWTRYIRFLFWVRSRTPQTASVKSRIFLVFLKFENFLWFFRKADLDSVYTISILEEVENTSNGFCEKSYFFEKTDFYKSIRNKKP